MFRKEKKNVIRNSSFTTLNKVIQTPILGALRKCILLCIENEILIYHVQCAHIFFESLKINIPKIMRIIRTTKNLVKNCTSCNSECDIFSSFHDCKHSTMLLD